MIAEALLFAASWALSPRRMSGEIASSVRLWARSQRCQTAWASHEARCHAAVDDAIDELDRRRTAVVLGSGLLRDVPIRLLSEVFDHVVLVDLQHLAHIRFLIRFGGYGNVSLVHADLSGLDDADADQLAFIDTIGSVDLIISANILSQIVVGARRALKGAPADLQQEMARQLANRHIASLERRKTHALLLTDIRYTLTARDGTMIEEGDLLAGADPGQPDDEWNWDLAPFGEMDPTYKVAHRAMARLIPPAPEAAPPPLP